MLTERFFPIRAAFCAWEGPTCNSISSTKTFGYNTALCPPAADEPPGAAATGTGCPSLVLALVAPEGTAGTSEDSEYFCAVWFRSVRASDCELSSPRRLRPEVCGYESPHVSFLLFNCYNLSSSYPWAGARLGLPLPRWISFGFDAMQKNPKIQNPNYVVPCTWIPRMGNFGWWSDFLAPSGTSLVNKATWDPSQKTHSLGDFCRAGKEIAPRRGTAGLIAVLIAGGGLGWC